MRNCWVIERFYILTVLIVMQMYTFVNLIKHTLKGICILCKIPLQKNEMFLILCETIVGIEMVIFLVQPGRNKLKLTLEAVSK